jgi:hypothetical protein
MLVILFCCYSIFDIFISIVTSIRDRYISTAMYFFIFCCMLCMHEGILLFSKVFLRSNRKMTFCKLFCLALTDKSCIGWAESFFLSLLGCKYWQQTILRRAQTRFRLWTSLFTWLPKSCLRCSQNLNTFTKVNKIQKDLGNHRRVCKGARSFLTRIRPYLAPWGLTLTFHPFVVAKRRTSL